MLKEKFAHWCVQLHKQSLAKRWRSLVVLVGDETWLAEYIDSSLTVFLPTSIDDNHHQGLIYSEAINTKSYPQLTCVKRKNYTQYLGTEQNVIIFSAENKTENSTNHLTNDFDVDAFAALSGTLIAGGICILLLKPQQIEGLNCSASKDYFLQRFLRKLVKEQCYFIDQAAQKLPQLVALNNDDKTLTSNNVASAALSYGCVTQEQVLAVDAMLKVLSGHRNRPLVLTADRGRGKSSALALAACQMLTTAVQPLKIIITAANKQALNIFFQHIEWHLPDAKLNTSGVEHKNGSIEFYPIDVLLKEQPMANLVMIDEAAALPVYLLQQLLGRYHRLIFATTIHGYEGAGRGFSIKFRQVLQRVMPNWRKMHMNEAIRWASDDPLEQFVFDSCLLNATLPNYDGDLLAIKNTGLDSDCLKNDPTLFYAKTLSVESISAVKLLQDEVLLRQVFAVLVTAHYQTSPNDVQLLLNNSSISLLILKRQNDILGVVMLMQEGCADEALIDLVRENKRRLRDQFLPQSLLTHSGIKDSFNYSYQRVMRIAIHPQFQGQGLGSYFLNAVEKHIIAQGMDFIGASFAGNATLVKFWQQAGYTVARLGFSKDKASGEHSCVVISPLTPKAAVMQQAIKQQFYQQFDYWLSDEFTDLPTTLVWQLLHANTELNVSTLSSDNLQSVHDFISGQRQFSSCVYGLHQWLLKHCTEQFDADILPLIARVFQKNSVEEICQQYGFTGKKTLNQHLINYIAKYEG